MSETKNSKQYDLEDRTLEFARNIRSFIRKLPKTISVIEDSKQLIRSSGSVGANYIEANESLSKKDFALRLKISRKEAKESRYWLRLLLSNINPEHMKDCLSLIDESEQLLKILTAILKTTN